LSISSDLGAAFISFLNLKGNFDLGNLKATGINDNGHEYSSKKHFKVLK
jgi:hypothetical protein